VLKVARTIADLAGSETVDVAHMSESIAYRRGDLSLAARAPRAAALAS